MAAVYEIDVMQIGNKEYVTVQDAARYLHTAWYNVDYYASQGKMKMERVESRRLLEWQSVLAYERKYPHKYRKDYEVKIVRPALPQV